MKRIIFAVILVLACFGTAMAGTIKANGMSQKDLYSLLNSIVTKHNALATDYEAMKTSLKAFKTYSTVKATLTATPSTGGLSLTQ
jgi:hypothetical protein